MNTRRYLFSLLAAMAVVAIPHAISASSQDESLRDDVFAMVATSSVLNTILVLDTSEQTNAFAYSGYVDTCSDALSKLNKSIKLCWQAYNDCQVTNANIGCGGSIDCTTTQTKCQTLETNRNTLNGFCSEVGSVDRYAEPGLLETDAGCDPAVDANSRACRFVGPWNPARDDYEYDLCFYDWAADTGADMPNAADWSYSQYPNNPETIDGPDRRDWKCLSETMNKVTRSGLWLNWKFATSLDAMKILLTDDHRFAYEPRRRGATMYTCKTMKWTPVDPEGSGKCWQWFDTVGAEGDAAIQSMVKANWKAEDTLADLCTGESGSACEALCKNTNPSYFAADPSPTPAALSSTAAGCSQCFSNENAEIPCDLFTHETHTGDLVPATATLNASNYRSACRVFHCGEPKCRDDATCSSSGCGAVGAYSEWDQDINHCCSSIGPGGFECVEGGGGAPSFIPGPGVTVSVEQEADFDMVPLDLGQGEYYAGAEVTIDSSLTLTVLPDEDRLANATVQMFYGCKGETASLKFFEQPYTVTTTENLAAPIALAGCDTKGYKIRIVLSVTHKDDADGLAAARLAITPKLFYDKVTPSVVSVFDSTQSHYQGLVWEPLDSGGGAVQVVKEYECKTIFYSMKSNVVNGGGGACDTPQCDSPPCKAYPACLLDATCAVPYSGCTHKETTTIDQDQWGSATKTLCTFLCPDSPQYDDLWKCMGFFEMNDSLPYPNGGGSPVDSSITCRVGVDSVYACCSSLNNYAANYEVFKAFDSNYYEDITGSHASGTYKCGMASVTKGMANNQLRWTGGTHTEITKGHINEVAGGSYLLNPVGSFFKTVDADGNDQYGPTPYAGVDKWYSALALPNYSGSAIASSFVSVFKTGENGTRDPACIYNIVQDLYGEDCDTCGAGCCMMDMGDINYCDYPSFWIKVAKTEGGNLVLEPTSLVGAKLEEFKQKVIALKGIGGSAMSETLYDVWRFLGGLKPAYTDKDTAQYATNYPSPIQSDPQCFVNNVILISGGQPNFDSNTTMDGSNFNITAPSPAPTTVTPYVLEVTSTTDSNGHTAAEPLSTGTPPETRPYYVENWYKTALPEVAQFVHTTDAYHSDLTCRNSAPANYRFGFTAAPCAPANDTSGTNVIDRIDTVGIGNWTLAPIYATAGNNTGYLDPDLTLAGAATNGGGNFYGLTAGSTSSSGNTETFANLSSLFNQFAGQYEGTKALGKPTFTTSPTNPLGKFQTPLTNSAFVAGALPISNMNSRFWFGNLKKYYMIQSTAGKTCLLGESALVAGSTSADLSSIADVDILDDCYNPSTTDITTSDASSGPKYNKVMSGGVAKNLGLQLQACTTPATPCYQGATGRTIYYNNGAAAALVDFKTKSTATLKSLFNVGDSADVRAILDYVYGYDSVDHDGDGNHIEKRTDLAPLVMNDPFVANQTITIPYSILGAIVHSTPLAVYYDDTTNDANLRVYVGANDGLLHAFDGVEGAGSTNEKWAYMPSIIAPEMDFILSGVDAMMFNSTIDGPMTLFHIDDGNGNDSLKANGIIDNGEKAYLIFGYRRGIDVASGSGYYTILDISNKDTPTFVQNIAISGQSWSKPFIFRRGTTYYLAFGGGYDPCFDADVPNCPSPKGAQIHIYAYDGTDFNLSKTFTSADSSWLVAPVAAEAIAINTAGDLIEVDNSNNYTGDTEKLYFIDITGTIFRIDCSTWTIQALMTMRDTPGTLNFADGIRTYHSFVQYPVFNQYIKTQVDGNGDGDLLDEDDVFFVPIPFVTGNLVNPKERSVQYEIVTLYDRWPNVANGHAGLPATTLPARYETSSGDFVDMTLLSNAAYIHNGSSVYANLVKGYYIRLDAANGEKGMAAPLVYYNWDYDSYTLFTTTYKTSTASVNTCGNSGESFLYGRILNSRQGASGDATSTPPSGDDSDDSDVNDDDTVSGSTGAGGGGGQRVNLDDRYNQLGNNNAINLGEGLAATPSIASAGRAGNDEMMYVSVGDNIKTFSLVQPPPPKTVRILKWYELY